MALRPAHTTALASFGLLSLLGVSLAAGCSSRGPAPEIFGTSSAPLIADNYDGSEMPVKTLALTFDDGPGDFGADIADYLQSEGIQAGFFDNGDRFVTSQDLDNENGIDPTDGAYGIVQKCLDDGHIVGNHTVTHRDMVDEVLPQANGATQLFDELNETDIDLQGYIPSGFFLFRSPYGSYNGSVYNDLKGTTMNKYVGDINWAYGGVSTNWPNQAADWACWQGDLTTSTGAKANGTGYATTTQCGDAYMADITSGTTGGIVLMHDPYSWAQGNTLAMVKYIVPKLKNLGYTFVRIDDVPSIRAKLPACDPSCATKTSCHGTAANQCTACPTGHYLNSGTCSACATCGAGSFQTAACTGTANTVCAMCPAGSYTGASGETSCTACPAGSYAGASGSKSCTACAAGTATSGTGQTACTTCAAGSYSDAGSTTCSTCAAGSSAPSDSAACTECTAGTYAAAGAGACTACASGTYAAADAASCTACGSCDDGMACTTDTCDPMNGCVHTPMSGCTGGSDGGVDSGSPADGGTGTSPGTDGGSGSVDDAGSILDPIADASTGGGGGSGSDGGVGALSPATGDDASASGDSNGSGGSSDDSGGCNQSGGSGSPVLVSFAVAALLLRRRRRAQA